MVRTKFVIHKEKTIVPEDDIMKVEDYIDFMNGIVFALANLDEWRSGYRNQLAVDITVGCTLLGIDAIDMLDKLIDLKLIDPDADDEDTETRFRVVLDYKDRFRWGWMINPDDYVAFVHCHDYNPETLPVFFELAD